MSVKFLQQKQHKIKIEFQPNQKKKKQNYRQTFP